MTPNDIGPHPDAPASYFFMGKPSDWSEEDCGSLAIRRVGATGEMLVEPAARIIQDDLPSGDAIYPAYLSQWTATEAERSQIAELLVTGQPIEFRTLIAGNALPPMSIWLRGHGEI
jgi:hypothetical protein